MNRFEAEPLSFSCTLSGGVVVFLGALETGSPLDAISIVHPSSVSIHAII